MATGMGNSARALNMGATGYFGGSGMDSGQAARFATDKRIISIDSLIEGDIIPRLLLAHREEKAAAAPSTNPPITRQDIERFAPLPLELEADKLLLEVDQFLARGVSIESVFVDLLAASARFLGESWERDDCDFVDVTMGLWRLQEVMREIALRSPTLVRSATAAPRALFAPIPGDQHSFGALMVDEVFSHAGWQSEAMFEPQRHELLRCVGASHFDLIGLTVSCDCPSGALADLITAIRSVSRNAAIRVIIGGHSVNADPGLVARVGADGTAPDAQSALVLAERLVVDAELRVTCA